MKKVSAVTLPANWEWDSEDADKTLPAGEDWDGGVITKEPTTTENGMKTYTCTVCKTTRTEEIDKLSSEEPEIPAVVDVTSITLNKTAAELKTGETLTLAATVNPENATDKTVKWTTSDAKVATVSNGAVTAVEAGTATITATAGGKKATCKVTVNKNGKVTAKKAGTVTITAKTSNGKKVTCKVTVKKK